MSPYSYETTAEEVANDLKSQIAGKTILVTGVSPKGLGAAFAEIIAQYGPECIILATRDLSKAEETGQAIKATSPSVRTHSVELDLASLDQVRKAAAKIQSFGEKIDVIVNNAAIMASPYFKTVDGIEGQFAVNYLGHFLLTNLLLPDMLARNVPIRIVNVSSNGCRYGPVRFGDLDFSDGKHYNRWISYGQSKSASMLYTKALVEKLGHRHVHAFSLHPGVIMTNLSRSVAMEEFAELGELDKIQGHAHYWNQPFGIKSPSQGVATHVFAAFSPEIEKSNGAYLTNCKVKDVKHVYCWTRDSIDAERLWELSEKLVGQEFTF
ncbi:unnamed protein product [Clonostachys rosea f. rosea IK726]|uniref:Short-chain dehydrogenase n=2 Tax=Bionectria ochroleuca TaxID=29856 RepID=A0A0B7K543_BIOOC|nr:unnamed protein product [Clonostachys rosea f. rosea IK726]